MTDIIYTANDVYRRLEVSDSTLRKYTEVLQREGYIVKKNKRGRREYTEHDVMVIEKLIELSKHDGMTLEKAAKLIVQKLENFNQNTNTEETQETDLVPFHIILHFQRCKGHDDVEHLLPVQASKMYKRDDLQFVFSYQLQS